MTGLALQIDGKWAVLSDGDSVNIENNSPVWGEGNSFSLPFELDIEANRHILGNADQITGQSVYEVLDGKRAVLYTLGIPVYYGKIKMEDEVELSEGKVDVTLVSGNLTFDEMIEGMNCQDVELMDEIEVGIELESVMVGFEKISSDDVNSDPMVPEALDNSVRFIVNIGSKKFIKNVNRNNESTINISDPYPKKNYCNVPIAIPNPESAERGYIEFEADREGTGICFYVLYFLKCLFHQLGVSIAENRLPDMEDMNRLAFFSTRCDYEKRPFFPMNPNHPAMFSLKDFGILDITSERSATIKYVNIETQAYFVSTYPQKSKSAGVYSLNAMYATAKNLPDAEVSEVISSIKNAFGIVLLFDEKFNTARFLYYKDILKDSEVRTLSGEIFETAKLENNISGFELAYSSGSDDNTSFFYSDYSKVNVSKVYQDIRKEVSAYNKTLYIDCSTGNGYRIKVDEEAVKDNTKSLNPSLVEVGEFVSAKYGDCTREDYVEKKEIGFTPIIVNDVSDMEGEAEYMVFLDVEMGEKGTHEYTVKNYGNYGQGQGVADPVNPSDDNLGQLHTGINYSKITTTVKYDGYDYSEQSSVDGSPINQYDAGFTLGIIRPGAGSSVEDTDKNYDGEGNYKYYVLADNPAFISDTIDHYGNVYDYDPAEGVGTDPSGRFSLKPRAEKPNPEGGFYPITESYAQKRGLFDKFYSEYAYFVVNRKIVKMKCRMEMADLLNIDWIKRYKIGEYVGFINKYSYSVSSSGISDVELEMYYI